MRLLFAIVVTLISLMKPGAAKTLIPKDFGASDAANVSAGTPQAGQPPAFAGQCSSSAGASALSCPKNWRGSIAIEAYGADPTGSTSSDAALDAAITAAGGGCVTFGPGNFLFNNSHSYYQPICIIGVGKGTGPGNSSHSYDHTTQMIINSKTNILFNVVHEVGSRFHGFRCNTAPAARPATTNGCIKLSASGGVNVASPIIDNIGTTTVARPIQIVAPAWPAVTDSYFDDWAGAVETDAAIYCSTTLGREGACGFISHNYFVGGVNSGPALFSEIGYTDFHDNETLSSGTTIHFKYKHNAAGYTKVHDNTIENSGKDGKYALIVETGDGSKASYLMIQNNEFFPSPSFTTTGTILIKDTSPGSPWVTNVLISGNVLRQQTAFGGEFIRIGSGENVQVTNNLLEEIGSNAPYGIKIGGISTNAGLTSPILVMDNTFLGAFSNRYAFAATANVVLRDMAGSTVSPGGSQLPQAVGYGSEAVVTDGRVGLSWGAAVRGGGTAKYKVFYNGSSWTIEAK
jgi:hypothetical protein